MSGHGAKVEDHVERIASRQGLGLAEEEVAVEELMVVGDIAAAVEGVYSDALVEEVVIDVLPRMDGRPRFDVVRPHGGLRTSFVDDGEIMSVNGPWERPAAAAEDDNDDRHDGSASLHWQAFCSEFCSRPPRPVACTLQLPAQVHLAHERRQWNRQHSLPRQAAARDLTRRMAEMRCDDEHKADVNRRRHENAAR